MAGQAQLSGASLLTQRLLWNMPPGEQERALPIVVLLGPTGDWEGKALQSIFDDCGATVVHSRFDFLSLADKEAAPGTTATALAFIAGSMSRSWPGRPRARFYRFALGWIAVNTELNSLSVDLGKDNLGRIIKDLTQRSVEKANAAAVEVVDAAETARVLPTAAADLLKKVLPDLIRALGRHPLRVAARWYAEFPDAQGAAPLDALYHLHQNRGNIKVVTRWLMNAFLADVATNFRRMARVDLKSTCSGCRPEDRSVRKHAHNWVLLLDNVDHRAGTTFVADLREAREEAFCHDPLLVIAASGRWDSSWEIHWRPPWQSQGKDTQKAVRDTRRASYEDWAMTPGSQSRSAFYPVLLEPLGEAGIAGMLGRDADSPECVLARKATAGLPAAVADITGLLGRVTVAEGMRNVLAPSSPANENPWLKRLATLGPAAASDPHQLLAAVPFATAPWLVDARPERTRAAGSAAGTQGPEPQGWRATLGIVRQLRDALWVSVPGGEPATAAPARLHPWLAATLNRALACSGDYQARFEALRKHHHNDDLVRDAYCALALGKLSPAVDLLAGTFDTITHREWRSHLELITSAPDDKSLDKTSRDLYLELTEPYQPRQQEPPGPRREEPDQAGGQRHPDATLESGKDPGGPEREQVALDGDGRERKRRVARLVAAMWLQSNPLAVDDPGLREIIHRELAWLRDSGSDPFDTGLDS